MATALVTGFGPFPGALVNPTERIVRHLARMPSSRLRRYRIATHVFNTSYSAVDRDLPRLIAKHRPRIVILLGLAANTPYLRIETLAHNDISREHVDAMGSIPGDGAIRPARASALRGRAPFMRLVNAARAAGMKAQRSQDAGRYVCNYVYWRTIEASRKLGGPERVVFVHVPELPSGKNPDGLRGLNLLVRAAQAVILAAISDLPAR